MPVPGSRLLNELLSSPGLVFLYLFNEQSGSVVYDRGPNRLNGAIQGNIVYSVDLTGFKGMGFVEGAGDVNKVTVTHASAINLEKTSPMSGLAVINQSGSSGAPEFFIFVKLQGGNQGYLWELRDTTQRPSFEISGGGGGGNMRRLATAGVTDSTDTMLGFSYDGSEVAAGAILYKNGAVDTSAVSADTLTGSILNTTNMTLMSTPASARMNCGLLAFWNRAVRAHEFKRFAYMGQYL